MGRLGNVRAQSWWYYDAEDSPSPRTALNKLRAVIAMLEQNFILNGDLTGSNCKYWMPSLTVEEEPLKWRGDSGYGASKPSLYLYLNPLLF